MFNVLTFQETFDSLIFALSQIDCLRCGATVPHCKAEIEAHQQVRRRSNSSHSTSGLEQIRFDSIVLDFDLTSFSL